MTVNESHGWDTAVSSEARGSVDSGEESDSSTDPAVIAASSWQGFSPIFNAVTSLLGNLFSQHAMEMH